MKEYKESKIMFFKLEEFIPRYRNEETDKWQGSISEYLNNGWLIKEQFTDRENNVIELVLVR